MQEGVIKFSAAHRTTPLDAGLIALARELDAWRSILVELGLLGRDPRRYGGLGFGNVSARLGTTEPGPPGAFLISGSQTGGEPHLALRDYCLVTSWAVERNSLVSEGETAPSSESLTHGAFYGASDRIKCVLHAHCPEIWGNASALGIACTAADVPYGTPEMARNVARLCHLSEGGLPPVVAMGGHEDGIFAVGQTAEQAGSTLIAALAQARRLAQGTASGDISQDRVDRPGGRQRLDNG